jgi:RimJ/RimL family protein N-acetyltransferase
MRPEDLQVLIAASKPRRRRRIRVAAGLAAWTVIAIGLTAVTVGLDHPSLIKGSSGAPGWLYVIDAFGWLVVVSMAGVTMRLSPKLMARRTWSARPESHGRYLEDVGPRGVASLAPDGTQTYTPWSALAGMRETKDAFCLLGHDGAVHVVLPGRGLEDPQLIPALREFLNHSVNGQPPIESPSAGKRSTSKLMATCWRGNHVVTMEHLRLQSPTRSDIAIMRAAASDSEAQRWLGWNKQTVIRRSRRKSLLGRQPGQGRIRAKEQITGQWYMIAIDRDTGLLVGGIGGDLRNGEVGGWLAPKFRGRRLGAELFAGATQFVHYHLGKEQVFAGAEPLNVSSVRALLSAGFIPTTGPHVHKLPDGRVIPSSWFHHTTDQPARCE